jgi:hypothetical protein
VFCFAEITEAAASSVPNPCSWSIDSRLRRLVSLRVWLGESLVQAVVYRQWLAPCACRKFALVIAACSKLSAVYQLVIKIKILRHEDWDNNLIIRSGS